MTDSMGPRCTSLAAGCAQDNATYEPKLIDVWHSGSAFQPTSSEQQQLSTAGIHHVP